MLLKRIRSEAWIWFAWRPVYASGAEGKPGGRVWLEHVVVEPWDCWGAGGYNYKRIPDPYVKADALEV